LSYSQEVRIKQTQIGTNNGAGELALLSEIRSRAARAANRNRPGGLRLGIGDDCALLAQRAGEELAVTTDLSIAGRHFRLDWHHPEAVGHRALARGLSDLAAMGARPVAAFLSLGVPRELTVSGFDSPVESQNPRSPSLRLFPGARVGNCETPKRRDKNDSRAWVQRFLDGLLALAEASKTPLAGGDLAESPVAVADIVLIGAVPRGRALLRSGARPGDLLYVTGALGGAAAGLARLAELASASSSAPPRIPKRLDALLAPHLYPQPRLAQGLVLQRRELASAAIDLSDGLSTDLAHLCEESGVSAEVDAALLPLAAGAGLAQALHGGEDYELLFTAPPTARLPRAIAGVPLTRIGRITKPRRGQPAVALLTSEGAQVLEPQGWEHFS
jgi:thiamine-monophosphate kinase